MLHAMDKAQLYNSNDLTTEQCPYVIRPLNALNVAQRIRADDLKRYMPPRFDPMPRKTQLLLSLISGECHSPCLSTY
ncbi:hypothetical protein [Amphritea pacifica]|uniref:Uncharacterized protein n=1 Tax=Amphritea pacifica TaxID=2811233 RepID=A0ABS2W2P2_9GAMM|nr:hypothetical protein [Amphritea pacifica]MBN0985973.1 hypothetical protein [Amphritea pacifica]